MFKEDSVHGKYTSSYFCKGLPKVNDTRSILLRRKFARTAIEAKKLNLNTFLVMP